MVECDSPYVGRVNKPKVLLSEVQVCSNNTSTIIIYVYVILHLLSELLFNLMNHHQ